MALNDQATDAQRQRLLPFVTRLACADAPEIERQRERYITSQLGLFGTAPFERGIEVLEGALAIGRQADPLGPDDIRPRMEAARPSSPVACRRRSKLSIWLALSVT